MPNQPAHPNRWLPREPSPAATGRVFLIPYSGCGASMYRQWPRWHGGVEFVPLELPGHETRFSEPNVDSYQALAVLMAAGVREYLDVPYGFFGHCGSALAAYEVSAELTRSGMPAPGGLFVSSEVAPQDGPAGRFLWMSDAELRAELEQLIREQGGTPTSELIDFCLEVLLADVETNKRYVVPAPYRLSCPITAIGWTHDDEIPFSTMGGWSACGDAVFAQLPGSHHQFIKAPQELIDLMSGSLGGQL